MIISDGKNNKELMNKLHVERSTDQSKLIGNGMNGEHLTDIAKRQSDIESLGDRNFYRRNVIIERAEAITYTASDANITSYEKTVSSDGTLKNDRYIGNTGFQRDSPKLKKNIFTAMQFGANDTSTTVQEMLRGTTLSTPNKSISNRFNKFARYGYLDPYIDFVSGTREYLFFSKPDLHLFQPNATGEINPELANIPFFAEALNNYKLSAYCLQQSFGGNTKLRNNSSIGVGNNSLFNLRSKYIQILTNNVTSTLDLPAISAEDQQNNQTLYGDVTSYREGSNKSDNQADFSLEFKDTKYLDTYMIFKIYDEYIRAKYLTPITPVDNRYIECKINPEPFSIWKIIVDDTGRIMYWAKATGVTPMNVPREAMSNIETTIKFTINFKAQFVEELDPIHLQELNFLTLDSIGLSSVRDNVFTRIGQDLSVDMQGWKFAPDTINGFMKGIDNKANTYTIGDTWVSFPMVMSSTTSNNIGRTGDVSGNSGKFYRLGWLTK